MKSESSFSFLMRKLCSFVPLGTQKHLSLLLFFLYLGLSQLQLKAAQLSGTITINPSGTPSTTVFNDLTSAITYLTSANTRSDGGPSNTAPFGVSEPLVIDISAGTYMGQYNLTTIPGATAINTITFKGAGQANTILSCTTAVSGSRHTIGLSSTSYIIIKDMTIRGESTNAWPIHIMGSTNNCKNY